jgi:hypothetical protein
MTDPRRVVAALGLAAAGLVAAPAEQAPPRPPQPASQAPGAALPRLTFTDVTAAAGIRFRHVHGGSGTKYIVETMGSGLCWLDYDRDGRADLYLVNGAPLPGFKAGETPRNALYRNLGDGAFTDVTERAGLTGIKNGVKAYGMGCAAGDIDNDGDLDLYVTNFGPNALYRNNGDGTFTDISAASGTDDPRWGSSAAFADYDGDGLLDLYVANYLDFTVATNVYCGDWRRGLRSYCHPDAYAAPTQVLYHNLGGGRFEDVTRKAGVLRADGKGMGVGWGDYDNDGDLDLYVANDSTPNFLFLNKGDGTFRDATLSSGAAFSEEGKTQAGMGVDAGDYDGDGDLDLFVTNLDMENNALYRNRGNATFDDQSFPAGVAEPSFLLVGFGTHFFDYDNDGDLDIFVGNGHILDDIPMYNDMVTYEEPCQLLENLGGRFREVTAAAGEALTRPGVVRGVAMSDYDGDGDLDVALSQSNRPARLLRNQGGNAGGWLEVDLAAKRGNPDGIGSRLTLRAGGRQQIQEVRSGSSYCSQHDLRQHFGLGRETAYEWVEVRWPSGKRERFPGGAGNRLLRLEEGKGAPPPAP